MLGTFSPKLRISAILTQSFKKKPSRLQRFGQFNGFKTP